jgi:hypothetical protein
MGDGLKRVAKLCGGLTVTANGKTVRYDANGKRKPKKKAHRREPKPKPTALTRSQLIYMWKIDGGNMSWARWSALVDVPKANG